MPFTADLESGRLDATALADDVWAGIYKPPAPVGLACPSCRGQMVAKVSKTGLRFFSHRKAPDECDLLGESALHRQLKHLLATTLRKRGFSATLEAYPGDGDVGGWRADVLVDTGGSRHAFEVQLSGMTEEVARGRTATYAADDVSVTWVTPRNAHWLSMVPSIKLSDDFTQVERGIGRLGWSTAFVTQEELRPLDEVLADICKGELQSWTGDTRHTEKCGEREYWVAPNLGPVSVYVATAELNALVEERLAAEEERRRAAEERERRARHTRELNERQVRVLSHSLRDLAATGVAIKVGVPSTRWRGELEFRPGQYQGNNKTAFGIPVWGPDGLWAVVCPVASRVSDGLWRSWARRTVRVYVEDWSEASRFNFGPYGPALVVVAERGA